MKIEIDLTEEQWRLLALADCADNAATRGDDDEIEALNPIIDQVGDKMRGV